MTAALDLELCYEDGKTETRTVVMPCEIGRAPQAGIVLKNWRVAKHHARIDWRGQTCHLEDFGALSGTLLNGRRVARHAVLCQGDEVIIGPCRLRILSVHAAYVDHVVPVHEAPPLPLNACCPEPTLENVAAVPPDDATWAAWLAHGQRLHTALLQALDLRRRDVSGLSDAALRAEANTLLETLMREDTHLPQGVDLSRLSTYLLDEALGLGPLEPLLADQAVTEIMVNRHDEIYIETAGKLLRYAGRFTSEQAVLGMIERIVAPLGRRIDESSPLVDARLRDGSRVNAVIPPVALRGASLTIRKFSMVRPGMDSLIQRGAMDAAMAWFLETCVKARRNILVSGGTGSGKTTLLNALSNCIPAGERIVTIEDAAELQLAHAHLVSLESRPANLEGKGKIEIRDLVRNALRMRPDRIVVGECRGAEAFDMLSAMNTGHEGSLTTLHANSARDALARLETMILMAGLDLPLAAVREHIASSVELVVQQARLSDGRRLILSICEINGVESGRIQMQELFRYRTGHMPEFCGCGVLPERCVIPDMDPAQAIMRFSQCTPMGGTQVGVTPGDTEPFGQSSWSA